MCCVWRQSVSLWFVKELKSEEHVVTRNLWQQLLLQVIEEEIFSMLYYQSTDFGSLFFLLWQYLLWQEWNKRFWSWDKAASVEGGRVLGQWKEEQVKEESLCVGYTMFWTCSSLLLELQTVQAVTQSLWMNAHAWSCMFSMKSKYRWCRRTSYLISSLQAKNTPNFFSHFGWNGVRELSLWSESQMDQSLKDGVQSLDISCSIISGVTWGDQAFRTTPFGGCSGISKWGVDP